MLTKVSSKWDNIVGEAWSEKLRPVLDSNGMTELMNFIISEYQLSLVYPSMENVFRAFRVCPPHKLKVIILGQDPYHDGSATGLAFANPESSVKWSPSLESIWRECERATDTISIDFDITLESWAEQGVLLLNTALTVKKHSPTAHSKKWHPFTRAILTIINKEFTGLHFCFWGSHAKGFADTIDDKRHFKYYANHPIAHAYNPSESHWKCDHFTQINQNITQQNGKNEIITW